MHDLLDNPISEKTIRIAYWPLAISIPFLFIGLTFKVMHWPFGAILILLSSGAISAFSFSKVFFITKTKNIPLLLLSVLGVFWIIYLSFGILFKNGAPFNGTGLIVHLLMLFFLLIVHGLLDQKSIKKPI